MKKNLNPFLLILLLLCQIIAVGQNATITGKVTDQANEPLPGVSILVNGTTRGTVTNAEGTYSIAAPAGASLVFSYIGYQSQTVAVNNRSVIDLQMTPESQNLSEVIVTALGIKREAKTLG